MKKISWKIGEEIQAMVKHEESATFKIEAYSNDEFLLRNISATSPNVTNPPLRELVLGSTSVFNGVRISMGDKLRLINKKGENFEGFVSYILNKDTIIFPRNKVSSMSALKWLLKFLSP